MGKRAAAASSALSIRAYARHRKVSAPAVLKAIKSGRLKESLVTGKNGRVQIADAELADIEWTLNTDPSKTSTAAKESSGAPSRGRRPAGLSPLAQASTREKDARAKLADLEYRRKSGELVNAKAVEARMIEVFARCRTKLLGLPRKAKALLPHLSNADVLVLDTLLREALEELATPTPARHGAAA